jgi:hypothetical protein
MLAMIPNTRFLPSSIPSTIKPEQLAPEHSAAVVGSCIQAALNPHLEHKRQLISCSITNSRLECAHLNYSWGCCQLKVEFNGNFCGFGWRNVLNTERQEARSGVI